METNGNERSDPSGFHIKTISTRTTTTTAERRRRRRWVRARTSYPLLSSSSSFRVRRVNHRRSSFVFRSSFVWIEKYLSSERARASILIRRSRLMRWVAFFDAFFDGDGDGYREGEGWNTIEGCVPRVERFRSMGFRHRTRASTRREDGWTRASAKEK